MALFDVTWSLQAEKIMPPVLRDRGFEAVAGDFATGDIDNNYIEYILLSSPGHWKEFPVVGVALYKYLNGTKSPQVISRAIRMQLENDIFVNPAIDVRDFPIIRINNVTVELNGA